MAKLVQTTYGDALFDLAVEESRVDALFDEAEAVIKAFDDNDELGKFLNHPKIKKEEKEERDVPLYCNITVACSICFTLSDTQYKGEGK